MAKIRAERRPGDGLGGLAAHATQITFGGREFRWRLGLRPLDLDEWIEWGPSGDWAVAEKARLSSAHHSTVFAAMPGIEPEAAEIADALLQHLRSWWPERFGDVVLDTGLHPLDAVARLVPEDLVLMVERDGGLVFGGGSVCFPNRWDLRSKLGRTMAEVHAPVAELNEQLAGPIDRFFERLQPERSFWRLGWGILGTDDWYTPLDGTGSMPDLAPGPHDMFLRLERETLRRFPKTNAVLFTIRTHVAPLSDLVSELDAVDRDAAGRDAADPDADVGADPVDARGFAADVADALAHMPPSVRAYKGLLDTADDLVRHLCSRSKT